MSYLIPGWDLSIETKIKYRERACVAATAIALHCALAQSEYELVLLGIFPSDLGLNKWIVPEHPVDKWFSWIQHKVQRPAVIAITHVSIIFPITPELKSLRLGVGEAPTIKAVFSLSMLYGVWPLLKALEAGVSISKIAGANNKREGWPIMEGYFTEPIIYSLGDFINIQLCCDSAEKAGLVLGGFVIERVGATVC